MIEIRSEKILHNFYIGKIKFMLASKVKLNVTDSEGQ